MSLSASCTLHMVSFVTDFRRFVNSLNPIVHQICIWYYYTQVNFLPTTFRLRYHEHVILKHRHKVKINIVAQMNISHDFVWVLSLVSFSWWTKSWYSKSTICVLRLEYAGFSLALKSYQSAIFHVNECNPHQNFPIGSWFPLFLFN